MTQQPRRTHRLSPSLAVSILALVIATSSGTAVAAALITGADIKNGTVTTRDIKNQNLKGKDVKDGSLGVRDLGASAQTLFAIVDSTGALLRGNGVSSVSRDSTGQYVVTFNRNVTNSGVAVSVVNEGAGAGQVNWHYCGNVSGSNGACFGSSGDPNAIFVNTEDSAGANSDRWFSVLATPAKANFTPALPLHSANKGGVDGR